MEFRLDDGQVDLQQTVARFCADRFPHDTIVEREGAPLDRARWAELADLGVLDVLQIGLLEAALVFEQLGSHLVPGPVLWSVVAASHLEGVVGGVLESAVHEGTALVEHAADIDVLLVVGTDGIRAHRTAELPPPTPLQPLDPLTPVGRFDGLVGGELVGGAEAAQELVVLGTVLSAAMLTGIANRSLEVARAYALEREQFGVPIGSFQAIKHLLADMYVRANLAQSATYAAAAVPDEAPGAKLLAGDAAIANASSAVQVLGGMGFTWEMLPNHLLKRAWVLEQGFGTADDHALRLGSSLVATA